MTKENPKPEPKGPKIAEKHLEPAPKTTIPPAMAKTIQTPQTVAQTKKEPEKTPQAKQEKKKKPKKKKQKTTSRTYTRLLYSISKLVPDSYIKHMSEKIKYAGRRDVPETYCARALLMSTIILLLPVSIYYILEGQFELIIIDKASAILGGIVLFIITQLAFYLTIHYKSVSRRKEVERVLPDALELVSANIRAGMTPFQALRVASRPEFGIFAEEVRIATHRALGSASFEDALVGISNRVDSKTLRRVVRLFVTGVSKGGRVAELLDATSDDIIENETLKKELVTNTKLYAMFIMFIVVLAGPALLTISVHFTKLVTNLQAKLGVEGGGLSLVGGGLMTKIAVTEDFLRLLSYAQMTITALLAAILVGVIEEGNKKYGMKYAPFTILGSYLVFYIADRIIGSFLGGII